MFFYNKVSTNYWVPGRPPGSPLREHMVGATLAVALAVAPESWWNLYREIHITFCRENSRRHLSTASVPERHPQGDVSTAKTLV